MEEAITGDFSLVKAWKGDSKGNLVFRGTARNFNPDAGNPSLPPSLLSLSLVKAWNGDSEATWSSVAPPGISILVLGSPLSLPPSLPPSLLSIRCSRPSLDVCLVFLISAFFSSPSLTRTARAGKVCIAEVEELLQPGELHPDEIHLPGIYVHRILKGRSYENRIERMTVTKKGSKESTVRGSPLPPSLPPFPLFRSSVKQKSTTLSHSLTPLPPSFFSLGRQAQPCPRTHRQAGGPRVPRWDVCQPGHWYPCLGQ